MLGTVTVTPVVLVVVSGYLMAARDTRLRLGVVVTVGMIVTVPVGVVLVQDYDLAGRAYEALSVEIATVDRDILKYDGLEASRAHG